MNDQVTVTGRRARSRKGEGRRLREEILEAAEALLLRSGSAESVSIRAVADAVGVTPPSIYRHFPDKATLMYEVWDRQCGTLDAAFEQALVAVDGPVESLLAIGRSYIRFGLDHPEPYRLVFMTRPDPQADPAEEAARLGQVAAFARVVQVTQDLIDGGHVRPEYTDPTRIATTFWAHGHGLVSLMITKPFFPWPQGRELDEYVDEVVLLGTVGMLTDEAAARLRASAQASSGDR
jgi:AcrR family transcriptional regulator